MQPKEVEVGQERDRLAQHLRSEARQAGEYTPTGRLGRN